MKNYTFNSGWTCHEKVMATGESTFGVVEGGGYQAWNHCSNFGFADLASCQERCANIDNCAYINYDPAQKNCDGTGYCYLNDRTHASTAAWSNTGTMCAKPAVPSDVDKAVWYQKGDACWLVFMGMTRFFNMSINVDIVNMANTSNTSKWGISGVHSGIAAELEQLVNLMDFAEIRKSCNGPLTVTGHSLGGAMAQLLTLAINSDADATYFANLKVDSLYTFGSISATSGTRGNDKNQKDGCFAGAQYYYAEHNSTNDIVDTARNNMFGGLINEPIKSKKVYVFNDNTNKTYDCETPLPQSQSLMKTKGAQYYAKMHLAYVSHLQC